jgi:hypothetical protein
MVKTKKKLPKFVFGTGTFVLVASMFALGFVIRQQYVGSSVNQDVVSPEKHDQLAINRQYEKAIERIEGLALRYKNITGKNFNLHHDMKSAKHTDSNLNTVIKPTAEDSTEPPPKADIVIGMAQDIDPKNLVTFCSSLRKYSSPLSTEVVLFMNTPVAKRSRDIAEKFSLTILEFGASDYSNVSGKEYLGKYHPSSLRWMLISKYFENENIRKKYSKVLLIDVRDSYFQSDPFKIIPASAKDAFYVFKGVESTTIADCGWNGGWVRDCFGNEILKEMGDNAIICSGVSIGTMGAVYEYLKLMEDILFFEKKSQLSVSAKFPECERNGVDQGVHNVLVHKNIIKHLSIMSERDGYVVNMQGRTATVNNKQVSNSKGDIFPIVHQYDRYPTLQKALFAEVNQHQNRCIIFFGLLYI